MPESMDRSPERRGLFAIIVMEDPGVGKPPNTLTFVIASGGSKYTCSITNHHHDF